MSNFVVLTACTNRKRIAPPTELRATSLSAGPLQLVASCWLDRLRQASPCVRAGDLYAGRGFTEARAAAGHANFYVVSAGLGIIRTDVTIPAYSLTVAPGADDSVLGRMEGSTAIADWWRAGPTNSPFHVSLDEIVRQHKGRLILAALPSAYLKMLACDLENLSEQARGRLRLFCAARPAGLPGSLTKAVMPYDARLDGPDSPAPGTRSDFAQRAMRHFTEIILPQSDAAATAGAHRTAVERALTSFRPQRSIERSKATDAEIIALIAQHWGAAGGRAGRMLRLLRDSLGIACEQRRFTHLFQTAIERRRMEAPA